MTAVPVLSSEGGEASIRDLIEHADMALAEIALVLAVLETAGHRDIADTWSAQRLAGIEPAAEEEPECMRPLRRARRARR